MHPTQISLKKLKVHLNGWGKTVIDFNKLYNPPCAFSEFTTCLYPPRQNHLPFAILAGEKIARNN